MDIEYCENCGFILTEKESRNPYGLCTVCDQAEIQYWKDAEKYRAIIEKKNDN